MDINRFTEKLQDAVRQSQSKAVALSHQQIDVEHLFLTLLEQSDGLAPALLIKADAKPDSLHRRLVQELDRQPKVTVGAQPTDQLYITSRLNQVFTRSETEAKRMKDDFVSVEHAILAMAEDSGFTGKLFKESGLTR